MSKILTVTWGEKTSSCDMEKVTFAEARAVEKVTGEPFTEALSSKSMESLQALIWVVLKRHNPGILFSDLDDEPITDVDMEWEKDDEDPQVPAEA